MPAKSQAQQEVGAAAFSAQRGARLDGRLKTRRAIWSASGARSNSNTSHFPSATASDSAFDRN